MIDLRRRPVAADATLIRERIFVKSTRIPKQQGNVQHNDDQNIINTGRRATWAGTMSMCMALDAVAETE